MGPFVKATSRPSDRSIAVSDLRMIRMCLVQLVAGARVLLEYRHCLGHAHEAQGICGACLLFGALGAVKKKNCSSPRLWRVRAGSLRVDLRIADPAAGPGRAASGECSPADGAPLVTGSPSLRKLVSSLSVSIVSCLPGYNARRALLPVDAGRGHSGGAAGSGDRKRLGRTRHCGSRRRRHRLRFRFLDVDAAFEQRTVLNADP